MGITIHLQGRLRDPGDVERLVAKVTNLSKTLGWKYQIIDKDLRGILSHGTTEPRNDQTPTCRGMMLRNVTSK